MKASDVMVSEVITVGPDTTVQEIANILLSNRISAVPVLDDTGALVGIVSEGDLMRRVEAGTERHYSWWLKLVSGNEVVARDFVKSHATRASDVMTKTVITAGPDLTLGDLASLLERHRIKRVPIVDNGKLVGIVSRANLLHALAALRRDIPVESKVQDSTLRERVLSELRSKLDIGPSHVNVTVHDGVVELWGHVESTDEKNALRVAAESVPGVRTVADHVSTGRIPYGI
jgi:CBS-domain-containing membrane protein